MKTRMTRRRFPVLFILQEKSAMVAALLMFWLTSQVHGTEFSWAAPVSGVFSVSSNWIALGSTNATYPMPGDVANFDGGSYTVTCSGNANGYTFVESPVTFLLDGPYDSGMNLTVSMPLTVTGSGLLTAATMYVSGLATFTVSGGNATISNLQCSNPFAQVLAPVIVTNGGQLTTPMTVTGSPNAIVVGVNSFWQHSGSLQLGKVQILDGGQLTATDCDFTSTMVGGVGAEVNCTSFSTATLSISNGGTISCATAAVSGSSVVSGTNATWNISDVYDNGSGGLFITGGGTVDIGDLIDNLHGCTIGGSGSSLTVNGQLNTATINVTNGGKLVLNGTNVANSWINISNAGSILRMNPIVTADASFAFYNGAMVALTNLTVPPFGQERTLTVDGSGTQLNLSGGLKLGAAGGGSATVSDNSLLDVGGTLTIGVGGGLAVLSGAQVWCQSINLVAQESQVIRITLFKGSATVGAASPAAGAGTLQINPGGELSGAGTIDGNVINNGGTLDSGKRRGDAKNHRGLHADRRRVEHHAGRNQLGPVQPAYRHRQRDARRRVEYCAHKRF